MSGAVLTADLFERMYRSLPTQMRPAADARAWCSLCAGDFAIPGDPRCIRCAQYVAAFVSRDPRERSMAMVVRRWTSIALGRASFVGNLTEQEWLQDLRVIRMRAHPWRALRLDNPRRSAETSRWHNSLARVPVKTNVIGAR